MTLIDDLLELSRPDLQDLCRTEEVQINRIFANRGWGRSMGGGPDRVAIVDLINAAGVPALDRTGRASARSDCDLGDATGLAAQGATTRQKPAGANLKLPRTSEASLEPLAACPLPSLS
jgi:hypothetical protein